MESTTATDEVKSITKSRDFEGSNILWEENCCADFVKHDQKNQIGLNIQVAVRVRPLSRCEQPGIVSISEDTLSLTKPLIPSFTSLSPTKDSLIAINASFNASSSPSSSLSSLKHSKEHQFHFNHYFDESNSTVSNQEDVYEILMGTAGLNSVMNGNSLACFVYGESGSGTGLNLKWI